MEGKESKERKEGKKINPERKEDKEMTGMRRELGK